ncbi:hypothetical protein DFQ27_006577 [Actinomortierella ambigua]|uniref:GmrSD restriction endonucleases C-terminal domain-containing protein n=1 Tax=Actinomortierella ambigua TaxID=1343610 RepID=A0A9P6PX89_9FUNG|nr:hypothetical protein DFQ27_006577 [Actinomortierella ambigua]
MISTMPIDAAPEHTVSRRKRPIMGITTVVLAAAVILLASTAPAMAALPTPVDAATARSYLKALKVQDESNNPPYNRARFRHWITIAGQCDTRETVLKRDGTDVVTNEDCRAASGSWVSPYDDVSVTKATGLDIDHMVPLKEAWVSGASAWTAEERKQFANDLVRPQLLAVTASTNRAKADKDPAEWMPPLDAYHCTYARAWVEVKHHYKLSVDDAEQAKLTKILESC